MRIGYFGLPLGALLLLEDGHDVRWAVLSPVPAPGARRLGRRVGRDRLALAGESSTSELERWVDERFTMGAVDILVSWYWTRLLPERWLGRARHGGIGVHPSLLPRHRGPDPFFGAIDSGDAETGVTVHALAAEYDTGAILAQRRVPVGTRNGWQLARLLDRPGLSLLREVVRKFSVGAAPAPVTQDEALATWAPEPTGDALRVAWSWPTERVLRRVRALSPVPGLALELGSAPLFVTRAESATVYPEVLLPGEAAIAGTPPRVVVRTGDGAIALLRGIRAEEEDSETGSMALDAHDLAECLRRFPVAPDQQSE
jgi:methionyl-tRNA formyltransferase